MPDAALLGLAREVDARCRLRGTFTLRSGATADEYFDKYLFDSDPVLLHRVVARMVALLPSDVDVLGGLEMGGVPLVTVLSQLTGLPALFVRKQAKTHGTRRLAEGGEVSGRRIVLVEDVITTGGAVVAAAVALREGGAKVDRVVCAIDRTVDGGGRLTEHGIAVEAVFTKQLLDAVHTT
jgi:orotate phosphoribosyltransferase